MPSALPVEPSPSAEPSPATACTLSAPTEVTLPDELGLKDGRIRAPLGDGNFLVDQFHTWAPDPMVPYRERARQIFSIWNRDSGKVERLIDVREPVGDTGYGQIFSVAVSPDWVVWTQEIDPRKTSVLNRHTGEVRLLPLRPGESPGGDLSVVGDTAVWYSGINSGRSKPRYGIYTADLKTGDVRRLSVDTHFASPISPTQIATSQTVDSSGHAPLSQPAIVDIRTGSVQPDPWVQPAVVRDFAAGGAGTIEKRQLRESTAENPDSLEDIVLRDRDGVIRTFGPYTSMGSITAGDRVFTWQDQQHLWALPSGQTEPIVLATSDENGDADAYATVHGPWLLVDSTSIAPDGNSYSSHQLLYRTDCSGPSSEPSPSGSIAPTDTCGPVATGSPRSGDDQTAANLVAGYQSAWFNGRWSEAWHLLAPEQRALMTYRDYVGERTAFLESWHPHYLMKPPSHDASEITRWVVPENCPLAVIHPATPNFDRAFLVEVDYPELAGNNAGWELLLVAPTTTGDWRVWLLR